MNFIDIAKIFLGWFIPFACLGGITFIWKELQENKKSNTAMKNSMISLLRSQIVSKVEKYMEEGYLPDYARFCLTDLFKQYEALGGNHGIGKLVDNCLELPPIKKELNNNEK